ncbi:hypothetical protein E6W93_22530 [Salmonella enterica subsp. enterica serovar Uppsala]|nr:hypothetical protein [Salmonella enterica subsp. enterica serovar Uppsala]
MKNLTPAQCEFIAALAQDKTPSRSSLNRTGESLSRLGLVKHIPLFGWVLTPDGIQASKLLTTGKDK